MNAVDSKDVNKHYLRALNIIHASFTLDWSIRGQNPFYWIDGLLIDHYVFEILSLQLYPKHKHKIPIYIEKLAMRYFNSVTKVWINWEAITKLESLRSGIDHFTDGTADYLSGTMPKFVSKC